LFLIVTMAGQQQQILDTIFNMKRRLLRKDDCEEFTRAALDVD
jgi:hypothetical protein